MRIVIQSYSKIYTLSNVVSYEQRMKIFSRYTQDKTFDSTRSPIRLSLRLFHRSSPIKRRTTVSSESFGLIASINSQSKRKVAVAAAAVELVQTSTINEGEGVEFVPRRGWRNGRKSRNAMRRDDLQRRRWISDYRGPTPTANNTDNTESRDSIATTRDK